jgi:hypothetical protein
MTVRKPVSTTVAVLEQGSVSFELIDDDGESLSVHWRYEWTGRDPLELAIYVVTELSGRPWKWNSLKPGRATISPDRCRAFSIRVGKTLRKENRAATAKAVARVVTHECLRPGDPAPDLKRTALILAGKAEVDWEAGAAETAPAMLRALRVALKSAAEAEAGLLIRWGE